MSFRDREKLVEGGLMEHPNGAESFVITSRGWAVLRRELADEFGNVGSRGQDVPSLDQLIATRGFRRLALSPAPIGAGPHRQALEATRADHAEACLLVREIADLPAGEVFMAVVDGTSMVDEHILPGDRVFLRRADTARPGEIVAAELEDGTVTIKRYERRGEAVVLRGASPTMPEPIVVEPGSGDFDDIAPVRIVGVFAGLLRGDVGVPAAQSDLQLALND
jgi:hypothetical protein